MKFTNGFWVIKPEFQADYIRDVYEIRKEKDKMVVFAPYRKVNGRADTVNLGGLTMEISSPMENVIKVRMYNYLGGLSKKPALPVSEGFCGSICFEKEGAVLTSGKLSLAFNKGNPEYAFYVDGKKLTETKAKTTGRMLHRDGRNYMVTGLNLKVGELVYGLGERFTPYVKNGQVVDIWNEDGGTASEIAYKNIPFYMTNKGYGVWVNHPGKVSFEVGSEKVETVQFSVEDQEMEYYLIYGPTPKEILSRYTALTGRAPIPPKWSFGLWLSTSFTTDYNEETVMHFLDEMQRRELPLSVFHFDCCWMKPFEWCNFTWDEEQFPDPKGMLARIHQRGIKVCVWINSYIAQKSPLFAEAMEKGYLLKRADGSVWQWDMWQAGMGLVDFTNPEACKWYQSKLKNLLDMGVDCFKTDFGERVPTDVVYYDHSNPNKMHNFYTYLYNKCVYDLLVQERGQEEAVVFARSAWSGGQNFPVHWGGDSTSQYISMAETLRGGLSFADSGFAYWSHDIGGFEDNGAPDLYKRWVAFGMLSSHSRLHGSTSYRVPWNYEEEACDVLRKFTHLKCALMPYLYSLAKEAEEYGWPIMRPMHMEFPEDPACEYLDRQYMLGDKLLVAPVMEENGTCCYYLPKGTWTHLLTGEMVQGGCWREEVYDFLNLPLFVKENVVLPVGACQNSTEYDWLDGTTFAVFGLDGEANCKITDGKAEAEVTVREEEGQIAVACTGGKNLNLYLVKENKNFVLQEGTTCFA